MDIVKKLSEYNFDEIKRDVDAIIQQYNTLSQIGLTHSTRELSDLEKLTESVGSIWDSNNGKYKFKETDFCVFNEEFKSTSLYDMYKSIPNIGRFRIMIMDGPKAYTLHKDLSRRYHYVLDTNPDCLFLFPDQGQMFHIPADKHLYSVDTRFRHTFVNASRHRRVHLVIDDLSSLVR